MKLTNKYIWAFMALSTLTLAACGEKEEPKPDPASGDGVEVGIKTNVTLNTNATLIEDLKDGNEMNVWIDVTNELGANVGTENLHAVNRGGVWQLDKSVRIVKGQTADVFAFYPYVAGATNRKAMPVDVTSQTDVLYSGAAAYASYTSNVVLLNMKHALSMLAVNVKKEGYQGEGVISHISVTNSDVIATKGTIDVTTGKITVTETGTVGADVNAAAGASGISGALPAIWVAPFNSKDKSAVKITLTIDGKDYTVDLPEITMSIGWQYIFHAVLSNNGLVFVPDATEEYSLNKADDVFGELTGHGIIALTYGGQEFVFPMFTGDNIYGSIKAADGSTANYTIGGSLKLGSSTPQQLTIETWNSTGFSLHNLDGVEEIDLSKY